LPLLFPAPDMKSLFDPVAWSWFALVAIFLMDAAALRRERKKTEGERACREVLRFRKRRALACGGLALVIFLFQVTALPTRLLAGLESKVVASDPPPVDDCDAVVVLGGGWSPSAGNPLVLEANDSFDRLLYGVKLMRKPSRRPDKFLVIGGGGFDANGLPVHPADSEVGRQWVENLGLVPDGKILALPACKNTRDEARRVAELVRERGWGNVLLVTSAWHMPRAMETFRRAGVPVDPCPADFPASLALADRQKRGISFLPSLGTFKDLYYWTTETVAGWRDGV
jgi:uncharacterized SAM-binding protein YcdF (DUF218 family)